jgi:Zn-dependent peptidase ImmA (M78 family)
VSDGILKVIDAFYKAKCVDHYYWMHTDGDDARSQCVDIENLQRIIELMTGFTIEKLLVLTDSQFHRALVERFDDGTRNVIYVMSDEPESEQRFATVKELCHILADGPGDFQVDPCITIDAVKDGSPPFGDGSLTEKNSEVLAEMIALELIYPMDMRRHDRERLQAGVSAEAIATERLIPVRYVYRGCEDGWFNFCSAIWPRLPSVDPPNLNHLL